MNEADALRAIPGLLLRTGYTDVHASFGTLNLRRRELTDRLVHVAARTRAMIELFWLERSVSRSLLEPGPEIDALVDANILTRHGESISASCIAMPMFGQVVLLPSPTNVGTVPYGTESFALALRAGAPRPGRCLDLCAGSGIQSLRLAAGGNDVVAIEIDAIACEWARRNAIVNSLEERIDVRMGDLWAVAGDEPYDYIVANPPLSFIPPSLGFPAPMGSDDGFAVMRAILAELPRRLSDGAVAHVASGCLGTANELLVLEELRRLYANERMRVVVTVTSCHHLAAGGSLHAGLVATYAARGVENAGQLLDDHLRSLGKTHFYRYMLVASRSGVFDLQVTRFDSAGGPGFLVP